MDPRIEYITKALLDFDAPWYSRDLASAVVELIEEHERLQQQHTKLKATLDRSFLRLILCKGCKQEIYWHPTIVLVCRDCLKKPPETSRKAKHERP